MKGTQPDALEMESTKSMDRFYKMIDYFGIVVITIFIMWTIYKIIIGELI